MNKLIEEISHKISIINNKYKNIEHGGCGTFSYYLHQSLKINYGIDTEIVYIPSDTPPGGMPTYDIKFYHILLKYDQFIIDNNGVYKHDLIATQLLGIDKLKEMLYLPQLWNTVYDHSQTKELSKDLLKL